MPARNGSVPEAPDGRHITQCGATLDAAAGDAVEGAVDPAPLADPMGLAEAPGDADVPALVTAVVVVAVDAVAADDVVAASAGSPTAPDDPFESVVPAMPEAVAAVCAVPGPASALSSESATRTMRNSWANGSVRSEADALYAA